MLLSFLSDDDCGGSGGGACFITVAEALQVPDRPCYLAVHNAPTKISLNHLNRVHVASLLKISPLFLAYIWHSFHSHADVFQVEDEY